MVGNFSVITLHYYHKCLLILLMIFTNLDPLGDSAAMGLFLPPSWELSSLISMMSEDLSSLSLVFSGSPPPSFKSSSLSILLSLISCRCGYLFLQNNITFNQDMNNKNKVSLNKYIHLYRGLNHMIEFSHNSNEKIEIYSFNLLWRKNHKILCMCSVKLFVRCCQPIKWNKSSMMLLKKAHKDVGGNLWLFLSMFYITITYWAMAQRLTSV